MQCNTPSINLNIFNQNNNYNYQELNMQYNTHSINLNNL